MLHAKSRNRKNEKFTATNKLVSYKRMDIFIYVIEIYRHNYFLF